MPILRLFAKTSLIERAGNLGKPCHRQLRGTKLTERRRSRTSDGEASEKVVRGLVGLAIQLEKEASEKVVRRPGTRASPAKIANI